MDVDANEWSGSLHITDSSGNEFNMFEEYSPDQFPVTVTLEHPGLEIASQELELPASGEVEQDPNDLSEAQSTFMLPNASNSVGSILESGDDLALNLEFVPLKSEDVPVFQNPPPWNGSKCAVPQCSFINLARRADRKSRIEKELKFSDMQCTRLEAVDAQAHSLLPVDACRQSHIKALERLESSTAEYGLILEDDAAWQVDYQTLQGHLCNIHDHIKQHPVIMLACNLNQHTLGHSLENIWLKSTGNCQTSSGYAVRRDYAHELLRLFRAQARDADIDQIWKPFQIRDNWAMTWPVLIKQMAGYSDIQARNVAYNAAA